ncbi:MAG: hypothetical protein BEU04_04335 [Marine Group III euryarchaeote CG-Bathy1]|uniref:Glutamine--fructose-6-phosphate aminotransferase [isomerizing] n=1 Tax=Marine Group III euryarchaeote CG-Bathy1 TaxID=1889001 RepID=A0A1J5TRY0_9ARCH|nr:MAG: hypothetical protein BEU04_04335 [Marine Group III euryarchaeote CG-Bathy1]
MCGIVAYKGRQNASEIIVPSLKKLEYRGYDSWGIAVINENNIEYVKKSGRIEGEDIEINLGDANIGIGHTRWATHGSVTDENAHPHLSNDGNVAVVHNGIIENYKELKKFLETNDFKFVSETDSEIIPNLIEYYCKNVRFKTAVKRTLKRIKGNYSIVAIERETGIICASRRGSPLVLGIGEDATFVASDIPAFLDYTTNVVYLYDGDIVLIDEEISFFNLDENVEVKREIEKIEWDAEQAKKGNFKHYMLKEISEQVDSIERAITQDKELIEGFAKDIKKARNVFLVACGSSYHASLHGSYLLGKNTSINAIPVLASEFKNYINFIDQESLIIVISQSGETVDVLDAVKMAKEQKGKVLAIVNVQGSSLTREVEKYILMNAGPEIGVLSTKTYTSQLAILSLISYSVNNKYKKGLKALKALIKYVYALTSKNTREYLKKLSRNLRYVEHIYTIGRNLEYPTALESALKIKEVSYIHAEGFAGGELKHGTIALIEKGTPCIVFVPEKNNEEIISNMIEVKSRGAYIIGIGSKNIEEFDFFIKVRDAGELNSICQIIPIQILAYHLAVMKGHDPDKPRNLAKSVTVK